MTPKITSATPYVHVPDHLPGSDYIPFVESQREDITRMIEVLNTRPEVYPPPTAAAGWRAAERRAEATLAVRAQVDAYRASITTLVLQHSLSIEQGENLNQIINDLVASMDMS